MAYCYLIFNVEFSISRKSKTCWTGTWSRSSPLTRGLQPVSVLRHNSCLNKQRVEQQGDGREQGHLKIKHTWMMKDLWVREQEYPMFWWLNVPDFLITITTSVSVHPSVCLFVYLCVLLPVYWLVCFSVLLTSFLWRSNCLYLCTSFSLHSCPLLCFVCMFSFRLPDYLSVSPSVIPSVGPSPRLSASPCIH